uniref:Succinate:cytochrome c oxidoreductase subunit 4 n=1 Tax=Gloiopeltis furcata TaxID=42017 RepID=A0A5A4SCY7_9FLOR|nr:succinate:cytochrome c oxidoreductase subunit 4 [Gloiopeltis furcata]BBK20786.1 succinate:cytochrome c oxidoreductase subunit 4 [Gloiopeltis furcata]
MFKWVTLRSSALLLAFSLPWDFEAVVLVLGFMITHIKLGLIQIVCDYVHVKKVEVICSVMLKISLVEMLRCFLEFLL